MRAVIQERYGPPGGLALREVPRPTIGAEGVLVRVRAASVNALDWRFVLGQPLVARPMMGSWRAPTRKTPGIDLAGTVEAVGVTVTELAPGDEVFGFRPGSFAEYVGGTERNFIKKPSGLAFEEAAALPVAGFTALQGLRDVARVRPGQHVLVNGSSGGVGHYAVQIAKAFGAQVTAVCGARSVEMVRSLGPDRVIDRSTEDFTRERGRYDVIYDVRADRSINACVRALRPDGILVLAGAPHGALVAPLLRIVVAMILRRFHTQRVTAFMAENSKDDLIVLKGLVERGKLRPVVDRTFPLSQAGAAIRYVAEARGQGKVVITL